VEGASGISDQWILDYVVPNMVRGGVPRQVCLVLGRAALWRIFDPSGNNLVPEVMRARVMARYADLGANNALPSGMNPVKKVPLVVDGFDSDVMIDQIVGESEDGGNDVSTLRQRMGMRRQEIRLLASQGKQCVCILSFITSCI
jgi:hypothetical protein